MMFAGLTEDMRRTARDCERDESLLRFVDADRLG